MQRRSIVIVGGGFGGTAVARALADKLPEAVDLTLVSEESYTTFNPLLAEAVGASIFPEQVVAPLRELLRPHGQCRFIMGRVTGADLRSHRIRCSTLGGDREIAFDHLVLAFGNRARLDLLPGMADHAMPLKTVGDAMEIRNAVLRRLARIELETDPSLRRALGHFVIIGGGFSGVEVAGELVDCLASIRRYYPLVRSDELNVTVLHDGERLLPELPAPLGAAALKSLMHRGVDVRLSTRAAAISAQGVAVAGDTISACTVVCTIGTQPNLLAVALGLPSERGRITVGPDLAVPGHPGIWAVGDCAAVQNAFDNQIAAPTAQFAVREGGVLANNLLRSFKGEPTRAFRYRALGSMASIGHRKGVAQMFGLALSGLPAWLLWRAYYLSQMPTLGRKIRIFVEWTWGMFFPADITHLRFTGSRELLDIERTVAQSELARPD